MSSFTLSSPKPVTHRQLDQKVSALVSGLLHIGFTSTSIPIAQRSRASIYADTSLPWQLMAQSFARLGCPITTAYTTLGEEGLLTSLVEPDVELVFCGEEQVELVRKVIAKAERVKWVIYDGSKRLDQVSDILIYSDGRRLTSAKAQVETIKSVVESRGGRILSIIELEALGSQNPVARDELGPKPSPDDLFCIMYTSGSTGPPKGVLLSHGNVISSCKPSIFSYVKTTTDIICISGRLDRAMGQICISQD